MRHEAALPPERFNEVLDWANHRFTEGQRKSGSPFQWKGRSPASVLRMAADYREEIRLAEERARADRQQRRAGQPVTWHSHGWDWQSTEENDTVWSAHELLSRHDLAEEGSAMHHCVAMYAGRCAQGQCAIFSIRRNGSRVLTVELELPGRKLCQVRGPYNRSATESELQIVGRWTVEMDTAITAQ
ncbi:MAG: PcfJ domain-containing protein [Verrucomicrobiales bacterium]|nr:PcfJ domain-containing protein [Verrucomicrobiales bacterium]